jgi:uncharacterized protein (TIGR00251 family)
VLKGPPRRPARIVIHLTPRAGRDALDGWDGEALRVRVAAPPADGRANDTLLRLLAGALGLAPSRLRLVSGATSRRKLVEVEGIEAEEMLRRLDAALLGRSRRA